MINHAAQTIAYHIRRHSSVIDDSNVDKVRYAVETLIGEGLKFVILCLSFFFLRALSSFLLAFVFFSAIRIWSGGFHFSTFIRCLLGTFIIYSSIIFLPYTYIEPMKWFILMITVICIMLIAPITDPKRPIQSTQKRANAKVLSLTTLGILLIFWHDQPLLFSTCVVFNIQLITGGLFYEFKKKHL